MSCYPELTVVSHAEVSDGLYRLLAKIQRWCAWASLGGDYPPEMRCE